MKYYKISEEELKKLVNENVLHTQEDEFSETVFNSNTVKLLIPGYHGVSDRSIQFEALAVDIDIDKLEGAVWHYCPKRHAHTEFNELKFKGDGMFLSGFCVHCEEELVRLSEKKEDPEPPLDPSLPSLPRPDLGTTSGYFILRKKEKHE